MKPEIPIFDQHGGALEVIGMVWEYTPLTDYWAGYVLRRQENAQVQMQEVHYVDDASPFCLHCLSGDVVLTIADQMWERCLECGVIYYIDFDLE